MIKKILYGKQSVDNADVLSVAKAVREEKISGGKLVTRFEDKIRSIIKSRYALSCSSGTAGLHLAMMSINLKKNDVVLMPAINFIASYSIAKILGAKIYLVDVDEYSGLMTSKLIKQCINENKLKKIKAIICMHLSGYVEDMKSLYKIKKKYNSILIEDACHALGSKYIFRKKLTNVGKCQHSDISVFSFHPIKSITTGEGGLISTNNKNIYQKLNLLRSHGIRRNKKKYWEYNIKNPGLNYRISDINCALGISQANKLKSFLRKRKIIAKRYISLLKPLKNFIKTPSENEIQHSACHLFIISINFKKINSTKDKFIAFMNKRNIFPQFHYIPIFKFDVFKFNQKINFQNSLNYYKNSISIPIYYNLSFKEQKYVAESIIKFIKLKKIK